MEIQKIFSEDNGEERLYSVLLDDIEMELFSEFQKEFNSKSMKALRNVWESAAGQKAGIPKYVSKGYRTIENPEFKRRARSVAKGSVYKEVSPTTERIYEKGLIKHPDYSKVGKRRIDRTTYDHGYNMVSTRDSKGNFEFYRFPEY